jgi:excisionase family DNA binding protein
MPTAALLSPEDLADYLQVPVKTIYNWRSARKGPRAVKVGRHVRFRQADVDAWLEHNAD